MHHSRAKQRVSVAHGSFSQLTMLSAILQGGIEEGEGQAQR